MPLSPQQFALNPIQWLATEDGWINPRLAPPLHDMLPVIAGSGFAAIKTEVPAGVSAEAYRAELAKAGVGPGPGYVPMPWVMDDSDRLPYFERARLTAANNAALGVPLVFLALGMDQAAPGSAIRGWDMTAAKTAWRKYRNTSRGQPRSWPLKARPQPCTPMSERGLKLSTKPDTFLTGLMRASSNSGRTLAISRGQGLTPPTSLPNTRPESRESILRTTTAVLRGGAESKTLTTDRLCCRVCGPSPVPGTPTSRRCWLRPGRLSQAGWWLRSTGARSLRLKASDDAAHG